MSERLIVYSLIPARGGSKGIPRKNIAPLCGQPLIFYSIQASQDCDLVDATFVSTDDPEIQAVAGRFGATTPFLRPSDLSTDNSPTLPVISHFLEWVRESSEVETPDVIVLLQPTSPLRKSADITKSLEIMNLHGCDSVVSVSEVPVKYNAFWQFRLDELKLSPICFSSSSGLPTARQKLPSTYIRNGAIYSIRVKSFQTTGSIYGENCLGLVMPVNRSINIDHPDDLLEAERVLSLSGLHGD